MSSMPPPPPPPPVPSAGPVVPGGRVLASPGQRIGARIIEILIFMVAAFALAAIFVGSGGVPSGDTSAGSFVATLVSLAIGWALEAYLTATKGGSLGKLILGLRVVNVADGSMPVSLSTATVRWAIPGAFTLLPVLGGLVAFVVWVVSLVYLFTDARHRTVADRVARTLVVVK